MNVVELQGVSVRHRETKIRSAKDAVIRLLRVAAGIIPLWISEGQIVADGPAHDVLARHEASA